MNSCICTLFEGDYHYGLAALVNSLNTQGYKGSIYAGYLGSLPSWTLPAKENLFLNWSGVKTMMVNDNINIHFIPLKTDYHLTNYKPIFMLDIIENLKDTTSKLFYFDPDIVCISSWSFFEEWLEVCSVALFEDVNSPIGENHPQRLAWRKYFGAFGISLKFKDSLYANGGFVGLNTKHFDFLLSWKELQELMAPAIGGLNRSFLSGIPITKEANTPYAPFRKSDQDALNATLEAWSGNVSFIGKEGMAIEPGEAIIPHAIGQPKPWELKPLLQTLKGFPPTIAQKAYWKYSKGAISAHSESTINLTVFSQKVASVIGRFYRKS